MPVHEILLDPKSDHDLRFFPSMLRTNIITKVTDAVEAAAGEVRPAVGAW